MRITALRGGFVDVAENEIEVLCAQLRGPLLRRGDADYDAARLIFNALFDRRPALIARCSSNDDVCHAVRFAGRHDLMLSVRGGGHSIAGHSVCDDGLVVDLSAMHSVSVDAANRRAHVAGGATWAEVDRETQHFGLATPGGVVSHTGVAGLTLNGGIGWLRNRHGLSCDNLLGVEMVTAKGDIVAASSGRNADLFWALRGGGGNFGVVTAFEFALHPVGPQVAAAFPMYPLADAREILARWRAWVHDTPRDLTSEVVLWTVPDSVNFPAGVRNHAVVIPGAIYSGSAEQGAALLEPLQGFGSALGGVSGVLPYCDVQRAFDASFPPRGELCGYWKSLYAYALGDELLDALTDLAMHRSSPRTMIVVQHMGAAVSEVPVSATAFSMRSAPFLINIMGTWHNRSESARHISWVRDAWRRLAAHATTTVYLNYLGEEIADSDALIRIALGANYQRLVAVKTKYDPENRFRCNHNVSARDLV